MYFKFALMTFFILYFFTGCSYKSSENIPSIIKYKYASNNLPFESASLLNAIEQNNTNLNQKLYDFYKEWKGVRYKFGGNSKKGIDCSALMQKVYKENFNINIPRTTALQSKVGKEINKNELIIGDLVFFKTGRNSRHVGIYIENGEFIHASKKRGVTISKLDNVYFDKHYWKSQRIID